MRSILLETRSKPGAKIRVSGGGRCNLLPSAATPADFHSSGSAKTVRNILMSWPLEEVHRFFSEELGIPLKVEPTGKVFPSSERPLDIIEALLEECRRVGAELRTNSKVTSIEPSAAGFVLTTEAGTELPAERVLLATGGLSLPKTGSDGTGYDLARALGHDLAPTFPVLVPLTTSDSTWLSLPGLSTQATLRVHRGDRLVDERSGSLLFTHRGLSGPVVLDISRAITEAPDDVRLEIQWGDRDQDWKSILRNAKRATIGGLLRDALPRRLADTLLDRAGIYPESRAAELPRFERESLERELGHCPFPFDGSEGYRTAEATGGGIRLSDVRPKTLESRVQPGLHFAGEILDVDGRIGGYNFLWAFVSGRRAGEGAARHLRAGGPNG